MVKRVNILFRHYQHRDLIKLHICIRTKLLIGIFEVDAAICFIKTVQTL